MRERVQKGNPYKLTEHQHVFPAASIKRFVGADRFVQVHQKNTGRVHKYSPKDPYFCGLRLWDHRTEHGLIHKNELRFQAVAKSILADPAGFSPSAQKNDAITDFYILWNLRHQQKISPVADQSIKRTGMSLVRDIDKESQELLEVGGVCFIKPDFTFPGQFFGGVHLLEGLDINRQRMRGTTWGLIFATEGEFIVPDNFMHSSIVPLTPKLCLAAGSANLLIDRVEVARINGDAVSGSHAYYFAKNLEDCPIPSQAKINEFPKA